MVAEPEQLALGLYEEHQRLQRVKDRSQAVASFLEWLVDEYDLRVCWAREQVGGEEWVPGYHPGTLEKLLAEFFEIDLDRLEREKQQMLAELRSYQPTEA